MRSFKTILVTGGAGFIGSNFIRYLLTNCDYSGKIVNLDALTYAGNRENLADIAAPGSSTEARYAFERADICDRNAVEAIFAEHEPDAVVHFAAETHVDRSILTPDAFIRTNVLGTFTLLDVARNAWTGRRDVLFHHVSTDEVYGSLGKTGRFTEETPYAPRSPYSASKASSDHLAMAYHNTYGLPVTLTNCSNNYGPRQFPEKLIPVMIRSMLAGKPLPVYGDGKHIRDWLYVEDHNSAVWEVIRNGRAGERYNIGGDTELENIELVGMLISAVARRKGKDPAVYQKLVTHVADRPGHDRRYAVDCSKLKTELAWSQRWNIELGLRRTVDWYISK